MEDELALGLAVVVVFGVGAQWLASRVRVPSILLLLAAGVLAGPLLGALDPDELFGELLFPLVSLAVGILLFEGGLSLRLAELRPVGSVVGRLVTIGVVATWLLGGLAAQQLFDLPGGHALLLAGVLVVSGPTVVLPLLRQARPRRPVGDILRWEGIVIDPIGALLAVIVFNAVVDRHADPVATSLAVVGTMAVGSVIGLVAAALLSVGLGRFAIPDHLQNPAALLLAVAAFTAANLVLPEAGLFATTIMGIAVANQRVAPTSHIAEFQEELGPLLLAGLFVVLGARIDLGEVASVAPPALGLTAVLVLVARPVVAALSTAGAGLRIGERAFIAAMAPRGIVAASVASLFALKLEAEGLAFPQLVPATFVVIAATVVVYGLGAVPFARAVRVAKPAPNGIALVGSAPWVLELARELRRNRVRVLVVAPEGTGDDVGQPVGVDVYDGRLSADELLDRLEEDGISQAIAMSPNVEVNTYALSRLVEALGRRDVFHLPVVPPARRRLGAETAVWERAPFFRGATQGAVAALVGDGRVRTEVVDPRWTDLTRPTVLFVVDGGRVSVYEGGRLEPGALVVGVRAQAGAAPALPDVAAAAGP